jgi:hypothetical protein
MTSRKREGWRDWPGLVQERALGSVSRAQAGLLSGGLALIAGMALAWSEGFPGASGFLRKPSGMAGRCFYRQASAALHLTRASAAAFSALYARGCSYQARNSAEPGAALSVLTLSIYGNAALVRHFPC